MPPPRPHTAVVPTIRIHEDDLRDPRVLDLLEQHRRLAHAESPPGSRHALPAAALRGPGITVFTAWIGDELAGCGALRELDATHGELKSMRTAAPFLRRGVGSAVLEHLIHVATNRGYLRLSLETGIEPAFEPARALYKGRGFVPCGPFGSYAADPNSCFLTLALP